MAARNAAATRLLAGGELQGSGGRVRGEGRGPWRGRAAGTVPDDRADVFVQQVQLDLQVDREQLREPEQPRDLGTQRRQHLGRAGVQRLVLIAAGHDGIPV
jgi:hypothetical protein